MGTYNGFEPGEERERKHRVRKSDNGHSLVSTKTFRVGSQFKFRYHGRCQCGQSFSSWDFGSLINRYSAHVRKAVAQ